MIQNFLAPTSIVVIIFFYVLLRNHPKHKYILPTILSSLGILGTFMGIAIGLYSFDVNNIDKSVPTLLEGLKLAFVSSIAGIIFTIIKKFELSREEKIEEIEDEEDFLDESGRENVIPILKEMLARNDYSEKLDELNLKLSGKDDKSMADLLGDILSEMNQLKLQADSQNQNTPQNLEGQIQELLSSNKEKLSSIIDNYNFPPSSGEINFSVEDINESISKIESIFEGEFDQTDGLSCLHKNFWFNVRGSNTENKLRINVEAETQEILDQVLEKISSSI